MVRLRLPSLADTVICKSLFQSHYGAIATSLLPPSQILCKSFQSHYGAIATCFRKRLETSYNLVSIPLWCDCDSSSLPSTQTSRCCFNPTMVRLRPSRKRCDVVAETGFNPTMVRLRQASEAKPARPLASFNPTMVRLRHKLLTRVNSVVDCFNPTMVRLRLWKLP